MTKYDPLRVFLAGRSESEVPANFREIEAIVGGRLPPSAFKYRAWWSNNADNHVNARAWLAAGYETDRVDMNSQTLIFRRLVRGAAPPPVGGMLARVRGALRGTVRFAPGADPTAPTGEHWDAQDS